MLRLREQVFGEKGYSSDLFLSSDELMTIRMFVTEQWKAVLSDNYPQLKSAFNSASVEDYHTISSNINHNETWPKSNRLFSQETVNKIKSMNFFNSLLNEFGFFEISDVYDTRQHFGREEIYWRLVRPGVAGDVGEFHADIWFHKTFNSGKGMFPEDVVTVKVWIPLFCEPGKSGLAIVPGSHRKEWSYYLEEKGGMQKPIPKDNFNELGARLIPTSPGNALIFHEKTIHGGVLNSGSKTRVSIEITMVIKKDCLPSMS